MSKLVRKYGKKKTTDLATAFADLTVDSPAKAANRVPLAPTSANDTPFPSSTAPLLSPKAVCEQPKKPAKDDDGCASRKSSKPNSAERQSPKVREATPNQPPRLKYDAKDEITALTSLPCVEPDIKSFQVFWDYHLEPSFNVTKIAQGGFASVLRLELKISATNYTVWKLIPIKPRNGRGSRREDQTVIEDAASEVKALACMSEIHGYVGFRSAHVLQGSLPQPIAKLNREWDRMNPPDESDVCYSRDQSWLLVEMSDAGTDLETVLKKGFPGGSLLNKPSPGSRLTIEQSWDIFWGIAEALAHGEAIAKFEHRDLHPGNICITKSTPDSDDADQHEIKRYTNLRIVLIDYTLSRATLGNGEILANPMNDEAMFVQEGENPVDARQFETYRMMRDAVIGTGEKPSQSMEKCKEFVPLTNRLWLDHILRLLLDETELHEPHQQVEKEAKASKQRYSKPEEQLKAIAYDLYPDSQRMWRYLSATEIVDDQMGRLSPPLKTSVDGEGEAMRRERLARKALVKKGACSKLELARRENGW